MNHLQRMGKQVNQKVSRSENKVQRDSEKTNSIHAFTRHGRNTTKVTLGLP